MKLSSLILASFVMLGLTQCKEKAKPGAGNEQVTPAPENSGVETERDRATEAVKQDTAKTEISIGKDEAGVKTNKGTSAKLDSAGLKVNSKKVKVDVKRDTIH
jgi:hypothetical protein